MAMGERSKERESKLSCHTIVHLCMSVNFPRTRRDRLTKVSFLANRLLQVGVCVHSRGDLDEVQVLEQVYR